MKTLWANQLESHSSEFINTLISFQSKDNKTSLIRLIAAQINMNSIINLFDQDIEILKIYKDSNNYMFNVLQICRKYGINIDNHRFKE